MSTQTTATKTQKKNYKKPAEGAHRSPCPALNALANHGYINRDGKKISVIDLINRVHEVYNISKELASFLAITGMVVCWDKRFGTVDLHELARHNRIEHNYSLVHRDAEQGAEYAPTEVDMQLLNQLLGVTKKEYLTEDDFVAHRQNIIGDKAGLNQIQEGVSSGETCMILDVFGYDKVLAGGKMERRVDKDIIKTWMGDEKLPDNWVKPSQEVSFDSLKREQAHYEKLQKAFKAKGKNLPGPLNLSRRH